MRIVRDRRDARWMPSRFYFALFRLYAFLRLKAAKREPQEGLVLVVDRGQTEWEHYLVALWYVVSGSCFLAELLSLPLVLALFVVLFLLQPLVFVIGLLLPDRNNIRLQSFFYTSILLAGGVHYSFSRTWVRFAAWQVLGLVALNAVAAAIVFLLRDPIAHAEAGLSAS